MRDNASLFGLSQSLIDSVKKIQQEETEYQAKVKAHMAKKGIKSLGDLSPEEKKKFFNDLDAAHKAKNESVEESTGVTDYNPKSQGGTRKELIAKYHKTKNPKDAEAARKAGATQKELQSEEVDKEDLDEQKNDPPFDPDPPKKKSDVVPGKHGSGPSMAKHLAKMALKKQMDKKKEVKELGSRITLSVPLNEKDER